MEPHIQRVLARKRYDGRLIEILGTDFIEKGGCVYLKYFKKRIKLATYEKYHDDTGLEWYVNSFYPDFFVNGDSLAAGFNFLVAVLKNWKRQQDKRTLVGVLSYESKRISKVGFYIKREKQIFISEDLESYQLNGLLVMTSDDCSEAAVI